MCRLNYIFWLVPLFMIGCAGREEAEVVRVYRPEFLAMETATPRPVMMVFDPPQLADNTEFGQWEVQRINLNRRAEKATTAGYYPLGEIVQYELYYSDRHGGHWGHWHGYPHGHHGFDGRVYRRFSYRREGVWVR